MADVKYSYFYYLEQLNFEIERFLSFLLHFTDRISRLSINK